MRNSPAPAACPAAAHHPSRPQAARRAARADRQSVRAAIRPSLGHAAPGNGMWLGDDLLAPRTRLAEGRRVGEVASRLAGEAAHRRPARFFPRDCRQLISACRAWGEKTGPNPTDRRKAGSKHHLVVDDNRTPQKEKQTNTNRHDSTQLMPLLNGI